MTDDEKPLDEQQTEIMRNAVKALVPWLQQENERLREVVETQLATINRWAERNERFAKEIAAMRPIVEAVAEIENSDGIACLQLCDTMYLTTPTESAWRVQHRANCVIEQARAYVAQHPANDEPNAD